VFHFGPNTVTAEGHAVAQLVEALRYRLEARNEYPEYLLGVKAAGA
jgi:hypothetical protein